MEKPWYKSVTIWGWIIVFIAGGLEAVGYDAGALFELALLFGVGTAGIGYRRAMKK